MTKQIHSALFGGTFNPIHNGHLRAAASAAKLANIARVIFIPSFIPPHRPVAGGTSAEDRYEMVRLACHVDPRFCVSDFELLRKQTSYSIETVSHFLLSEPPGTRLSFLIGTDAFAEIDTWHRANDLLGMCDFLVMARPGTQADLQQAVPDALRSHFSTIKADRLVHESGHKTRLVRIDGIEVSSTEIRKLIQTGKQPEELIPAKVLHYIHRLGLYR